MPTNNKVSVAKCMLYKSRIAQDKGKLCMMAPYVILLWYNLGSMVNGPPPTHLAYRKQHVWI